MQREKNDDLSEELAFMTNKAEGVSAELKTVKEHLNHAVAAKQRIELDRKEVERKVHELEHNMREAQKHREALDERTRERDECNARKAEFENAQTACEVQRSELDNKLKQLEAKVAELAQSEQPPAQEE